MSDGFSNDGVVKTEVTNREDQLSQVELQSDGKIIVVGTANIFDQPRAVVVRYLENGLIDSSFGSAGFFYLNNFPISSGVAVSIDSSGSIFVGGEYSTGKDSASKLFVVKLNSIGQLQPSFAVSGVKTLGAETPFSHSISDLSILADESLIVSGDSVDSFLSFKISPNGELVSSYSQSGVSKNPNTQFLQINDSVSTQEIGTFLVGTQRSSNDFFLAKLNNSGSLDSGFDGDGVLSFSFASRFGSVFNTRSEAMRVVVEQNGNFLVAGTNAETVNDPTPDLIIGKFKPNGAVDTGFGSQGFFSINRSTLPSNYNHATFTDMVLTSDGDILASGYVIGSSQNSFVIKLDSSGKLKQDFGKNGLSLVGSSFERVESIVNTPASKILISGTVPGEPVGNILYSDFYLGLLNKEGVLDFVQPVVVNLTGGAGNDRFSSSSSNDSIDGGSGVDTVSYTKSKSEVSFVRKPSGSLEVTGDGVDTLENVERLKFKDLSVAFDINSNNSAGGIYRLYEAAFNRVPDLGGLGFWIGEADKGLDANLMGEKFVFSQEFRDLYQVNLTDRFLSGNDIRAVVSKMYMNVLGREADSGGLNFYSNEVMSKTRSVGQVLAEISDSSENRVNLVGVISQGITFQPFETA